VIFTHRVPRVSP